MTPPRVPFVQALESDAAWDDECDVLVVGFGGAGATAAVAAADAGASVLVLEKMPSGGGNTAVAGGGYIVPGDAAKARAYLERTFRFADDEMDAASLAAFCEEAPGLNDWLREINPAIRTTPLGYANFPSLPGAETIVKYRVQGPGTGGAELFRRLEEAVRSRPRVSVRTRAPVLSLVHRNLEVVGAVYEAQGRRRRVRARKAVVLATGGFEYDAETLRNFCLGTRILGLGCPGNTGDGLRMAQGLGAKLWHMRAYSAPLGIPVPGCAAAVLFHAMTPGYIWIDRHGRRFTDESRVDFHSGIYAVNAFDPASRSFPRIPCWLVMDEAGRRAGPITHARFGYASLAEGYLWSPGCEREIESGLVRKADTLASLARSIGVPEKALAETVARWNADLETQGVDTAFGRRPVRPPTEKDTLKGITPRKLAAPLKTPPYYAVALYPALLNTQGGPRRNEKAQVLNVSDEPIPRLFAAGELGSLWGCVYQGSSNIAECLVFGRIAGRQAASLPDWQ